ncbi:EF-hand domain-containing protein [Streptomyces capoamus]|uniref:EF-hand domain-containing protein n=1 Tax=Streptomyces capoamus TaxID=68183 RepID=UPI001675F722|nr:EF-hand domain-containing protein [Streptomyces capoamus]
MNRENITQEKVQAVFKAIDTDGDGCITGPEIVDFLEKRGSLSPQKLRDFGRLDQERDGRIDFDEFEYAVNQWYFDLEGDSPEARAVEEIFRQA